MQWIVRLICGCDPEEARIALRLYWHEHRKRLALIAGVELLVLAALIGLSYALRIPGIPGPSYTLGYLTGNDFQHFVYPYVLIPVVVVAALIVVPRGISYPPLLSMRALALPWRLWAVMLAVAAHAAYWSALFSSAFPRFDPSYFVLAPIYSLGGAEYLFSQTFPSSYSDILLLQIILLVIVPPVLLLSFQRSSQRLGPRFIVAGAIWIACHFAWNMVYWAPIDIGPANPYSPQYMYYVSADVLAVLVGLLMWSRRTRLVAFCTSCIVYAAIHIFVVPIYISMPHWIPAIYVLSYCGLWSMGLPAVAWSYFVDVIR